MQEAENFGKEHMTDLLSSGTDLFKNLNPDKQEKVFQAAVNEFASKGYRNASMNTVVKSAGISKGSLFQYFTSKQGLFDAVVTIATVRVTQYLRKVREDTADLPFFDRLERLIRAGFAFIDEHPLMARVYFHLLQSGEAPFGSERLAQLNRRGDEFLAELIRHGISRGELRPDTDPERVAFLVNALLATLLRAYYTEFLGAGLGLYRGDSGELDRWVKTSLDLICKGVEKG
jgi:TetR/AcrR family transcriptional regulator